MIKLKNFLNPKKEEKLDEYNITDFDINDGWHWKEVDHLLEMGFEFEGDYRLKMVDKNNMDGNTLIVEIYKQKSTGDYVMNMNERKYKFKSFKEMLNFIETKDIN